MGRASLHAVLRAGLAQFAKYVTVGFMNTGIDLLITNILVILTSANSDGQLLVISLFASSCATINSYFFNRKWTFGASADQMPPYAFARFFGIACIAMAANASVFLFAYQILISRWGVAHLLAINLAKIFGIGTACLVGFFGYRVGVFELEGMRQFRLHFRFDLSRARWTLKRQVGILLLAALIVRLLYIAITTAMVGAAVNYAWSAESIASGQFQNVETFWSMPFSYWEALFIFLGMKPVHAAMTASLIPGVALLIPVTVLARFLYGETVASLAGWMTVFHPRLVEYSCNGLPDSLSLCMLVSGVTLLTLAMSSRRGWLWLFMAGACFGLYFTAKLHSLLLLLLIVVLAWRGKGGQTLFHSHPIKYVSGLFLGFIASVSLYLSLAHLTVGSTGTLPQFNVFLGPLLASGFENPLFYIPDNIIWTMSALPGMLLSPLWFFAVLLPLFYGFHDRKGPGETLLLTMLIYPFVVVLLFRYDAIFLLPTLIPIHILGSAAIFACSKYLQQRFEIKHLHTWLVGLLSLFFVALASWKAVDTEIQYSPFRVVAKWLKKNVPPQDIVAGDGFGFISTTGFLSGHRTVSRFWDQNPVGLVEFLLRQDARWLVVYEAYLNEANPEVLSILKDGLPGMKLRFETQDRHHNRIQVYQVAGHK